MKRESTGIPAELLKSQQSPCISIYMPTGRRHPDNLRDSLHFKNLVSEAREKGISMTGKREMQPLIDRLVPMIEDHDFWTHALDGIAVFVSPGLFLVLRVQEPVAAHATVSVAGKFYLKPLLRIFQATDRFHVLALTRTDLRLFEGNRFVLDEVQPASGVPMTMVDALGSEITPPHLTIASFGGANGGGSMRHGHSSRKDEEELDNEKYFRAVDQAITEYHSMPSGLPLVLAALPEHQSLFRSVSRNPHLHGSGVELDPRLVSADELRTHAWAALEPGWLKKVGDTIARFEEYRSKSLGDDDPFIVAKAAAAGRVWTLLLDSDKRYFGSFDPPSGRIVPAQEDSPTAVDVLEEVAMLVLETGGEVIVLPTETMPSQTGVAAIFRYV
ncbi:MAG: hypothetical protein HGB29_05225 [Chlorobiaceae bacterium]|nr:hypothetical protein [Chlorobiaceae bacterium]NTW74249.1 hypothetical protein [Chlorobiaceae bacterium]